MVWTLPRVKEGMGRVGGPLQAALAGCNTAGQKNPPGMGPKCHFWALMGKEWPDILKDFRHKTEILMRKAFIAGFQVFLGGQSGPHWRGGGGLDLPFGQWWGRAAPKARTPSVYHTLAGGGGGG